MPRLDRSGTFNAQPYGWALRRPNRGNALILDLNFLCLEMQNVLDPNQWLDIRNYVYDVKGSQWILGNDGTRQDRTIETLVTVMGWLGELEQFAIPVGEPGCWQPPMVQIKVAMREWKDRNGKIRQDFEARYVNPVGFKGQINAITEAQMAMAKTAAKQAGLADAVAALKAGKPLPPAPQATLGPAPVMPSAAFPSASFPTSPSPSVSPSVIPGMPPVGMPPVPGMPETPDHAPWEPPPGTQPFTGQF